MVKNKGKVSCLVITYTRYSVLTRYLIFFRVVNPEEEERTTLKTISVNLSSRKKAKVDFKWTRCFGLLAY